jgi:hypothetical protein
MSATFDDVVSGKSSWDVATIQTFLSGARQPLRLATINRSGFPQITSLWFAFMGGALWCCTQQQSLVSKHIQRQGRVGFEVAVNEPPYLGVSGHGTAEVLREDATALLGTLTSRHLNEADSQLKRWLMSRIATEIIIKIIPCHITSWDFSDRMANAVS